MATNIRPLHDRVIVRRIAEGEQARGGIIIPDTCLLYTSPSPRDRQKYRMPSSA